MDFLDLVAAEARSRGLEPEIHSAEGALTATSDEGGVLFSGHLDTVPQGSGWTRALGQRVEGRIYGRGSPDMKGAAPPPGRRLAVWPNGASRRG